MDAELIQMANKVVEKIENALEVSPPEVTTSVKRVYLAPIKLDAMVGRKIYVFPMRQSSEIIDRDADEFAYSVSILMSERCETKDADGEAPVEWVDERVNFMREFIIGLFDIDQKTTALAGGREARTQATDWTLYDPEKLASGVFWSLVMFEFREVK